jgi:GxxExxY protein
VTGVDTVTRAIIGSAIEVHGVLGPGLLESAYELALAIELAARGVAFDRQVRCPSSIAAIASAITGSTSWSQTWWR